MRRSEPKTSVHSSKGRLGNQDRASLVALAEDLEDQFRYGARQGYEAQFVDDQQVQAGQLPLQIQQPSLSLSSINSCTRAAAVVKPTDISLAGSQPAPAPRPGGSCPCRCCRRR